MTETTTTTERLDLKRLAPVLVIVLVDLLGLSIIIPLLPLYAARYGATPFIIGLLGTTYPLMQFIGAPTLGRLSDRWGRRPILLISQFGTFVGFLLLAVANSLPILFLARIISGLAGANIATAQAIVADLTTEKTRTQGLGLIGAAFGLGFILGPMIAFTILALSNQNYQIVAFTAAGFSALSILLTYFLLAETRDLRKNDGAPRVPFTLQAMRQALGRPTIGFLLVLMFAQQIAFGGYEQIFSLFALNRLGMGARDTSAMFVFAGMIIVVVQGGLLGRWSRAWGERRLLLAGLVTLAAGLLLTGLTPQVPVPWYDRTAIATELSGRATLSSTIPLPEETGKGWLGLLWFALAAIPAAVGGGILQPSINSLITKYAEKNEVGGILGISAGLLSAANATAPLLYGSIFQWLGAPTPFLLGGVLLVILWGIAQRSVPQSR